MNQYQLLESLFCLSHLSHIDLIRQSDFPWEILDHLKDYVDTHTSLGTIKSPIGKGVFLIHPELISMGDNVKIGSHCTIEGPCIIGNDCEIRSGAFIRPYSVLENSVVIGHCSECKSSLFFPYAKAPHFNYVGDSIIGSHVNLGAGVTCANLRLDHKKISVNTKDGDRF